MPHRYQSGGEDKKINVETVQDNLIIKLCDIVTIQAKDVDLDYAVRDTFQTDTAISSRMNGARLTQKELVKWEGAENGDMGIGLELDTQTNGWDANEMFQLNEKEHGIRTTFKDNLETYTVQIDKKDSQFSQLSMEAERIANEIENNPATRDRLELENGDEEAAFASVVRPDETSEKMTTPPPAQSQKYIPQQQQQQPPKRNPDGRKMMPANSKPMYSKPMQAVVQQTINPTAGFKTMTINPPPQYTHQPPPTQYVHQEGGKINGDGREGNKSMQPRQMRMINPPMSFNEPPPPINQVSNQHMGKPPAMGIHMPPPHLPNVPEGQQTIHVVTPVMQPSAVVVTHAPPPTIHMHPVPQPQRPQRDPMMRGRNDEIRQLQGFHRDFQLGTAAPPPGQQQNVPPQVPNTQPPLQRPEMQDNGQNPMSHPPPIAIVDMGKGQQHPSGAGNNHHQQHIQHHPTPSSTPHSDKSHGPSSTPPQATPPPANSNNVNSSSGNSSESTPPATLVEKSTLNPKAKPFTLNPQAKPFTPRSPSTPNQSR